jgi:hypothetical protein
MPARLQRNRCSVNVVDGMRFGRELLDSGHDELCGAAIAVEIDEPDTSCPAAMLLTAGPMVAATPAISCEEWWEDGSSRRHRPRSQAT